LSEILLVVVRGAAYADYRRLSTVVGYDLDLPARRRLPTTTAPGNPLAGMPPALTSERGRACFKADGLETGCIGH
jgi:hypothetical protein